MKYSNLIRGIIGFAMLVVCCGLALARGAPPAGWRFPATADLADDWRGTGKERKADLTGDFDEDGKPDRAVLLISVKNHSLGLFVSLSSDRARHWRKLDVIDDSRAIHVMGVELMSPGQYITACGKGYFACKQGEPKAIRLASDAINYFKTESASRTFYFDRQIKSFRQVWMSD
jgi:hypothetical protein